MSKVLIVGAGSVGNIVAHKVLEMPEVFDEVMLASRNQDKCNKIAERVGKDKIRTAQVNGDNAQEVAELIRNFGADVVLNMALPYQDLPIMDACLETGAHYVDTASYEPKDTPRFEYSWQWNYHDQYKNAGIMALLSCGLDPGAVNAFIAYAKKHHFDTIEYVDIVDCNAGDHGQPFATNFNPEVNIREITQVGRYYENGEWKSTDPLGVHQPVNYPTIGEQESYLMYHEELESLQRFFPEIKRLRFWMTFTEQYLRHLRVLENVGMTSIEPINFDGKEIAPLDFLKEVLPQPKDLGENYKGKVCCGCQIKGKKDGEDKTYFIYTLLDHAAIYKETGGQAIAYSTGVPAVVGTKLMLDKTWYADGVWNVEQFDPDPFIELLPKYGLPVHEEVNPELAFEYD